MNFFCRTSRRVISLIALVLYACASVAGSSTIPESYNVAAKLIAEGDASAAIPILLSLEKDGGVSGEQLALIRLALGKAYLRESKAEEAREVISRISDALDDTPQAAAAAALRADAERLTGAREEAERWYALTVKRAGDGYHVPHGSGQSELSSESLVAR